jgi:hypothetical protein
VVTAAATAAAAGEDRARAQDTGQCSGVSHGATLL